MKENYDIGQPHNIKIRRRSLPSNEAFYTLLLEVEERTATYFGRKLTDISSHFKRKIETLLIIKNSTERLKVIFR